MAYLNNLTMLNLCCDNRQVEVISDEDLIFFQFEKGCFSLMRVHHLHMNNVMAKYKEYANSPLQKLQYDMGEDRWLCTLMLMQGGRIEYEAGSHCFTFAPEELEEFYKLRLKNISWVVRQKMCFSWHVSSFY